MTFKECKLCFYLFCKAFEGKRYGEVIKNCYDVDAEIVLSLNNSHINIDTYNLYISGKFVMYYIKLEEILCVCLSGAFSDHEFKSTEDFLNYFKISLEDIV